MKTNETQTSTSHQPTATKPFFGARSDQAFFSTERVPATPFFQPPASATIQAKPGTDEAKDVSESDVQRMPAFASEVMPEGTVQRSPSPQSLSTFPIQAKLTIGPVGDRYEQEADRVAAQVVEQINAPAATQAPPGQPIQRQEEEPEELQAKPETTTLQRMEEKPEELQAKPEITTLQRIEEKPEELQAKSMLQRQGMAGEEATPDLDIAINRARGGGQPLDTGLQRSMGQAMGADFSGVKVHTDAQSDQLNQSIQARAFTTGQDVFFRRGAYEPGSRGGQELIAHELTHVVQQDQTQVASRQIAKDITTVQRDYAIQRAAVETAFGTFEDERYAEINQEDDKGAEIKLTFAPGENVDATKIGMVQSVKSYQDGQPYLLDPGQQGKLVTDEGESKGYKTDRLTGASNPIYGAEDLSEGQTLSDTKETDDVSAPKYKLGYRKLVGETWQKQKAELYDKPHLGKVPKNSGQLFESTALAIDGAQKDTFYGSVSWGWTVDDSGKYEKKELALESAGNPTARFTDAAKQWNAFKILPSVQVVDEKNKLYKTTAPLDVSINIGGEDIAFTLASGCEFKMTDSVVGQEVMIMLEKGEIKFDQCRKWLCLPLDEVDGSTRTVKADRDIQIGTGTIQVKAGTKLINGSIYSALKEVAGYLAEGALVLSETKYVWAGRAQVKGVETTALPIPLAQKGSSELTLFYKCVGKLRKAIKEKKRIEEVIPLHNDMQLTYRYLEVEDQKQHAHQKRSVESSFWAYIDPPDKY